MSRHIDPPNRPPKSRLHSHSRPHVTPAHIQRALRPGHPWAPCPIAEIMKSINPAGHDSRFYFPLSLSKRPFDELSRPRRRDGRLISHDCNSSGQSKPSCVDPKPITRISPPRADFAGLPMDRSAARQHEGWHCEIPTPSEHGLCMSPRAVPCFELAVLEGKEKTIPGSRIFIRSL